MSTGVNLLLFNPAKLSQSCKVVSVVATKPGEALTPVAKFDWQGKTIRYCVPNSTALWRVQTLLTKEPCTIEWLREIRENEVLLDVGANVGMYSLFAAVHQNAKVYSFEPESQNYALLNQNIYENQAQTHITAYCLACSDQEGFQALFLSEFNPAGSCHSLGEEVGHDLLPRPSDFTQGCYAVTIDNAIKSGAIPVPSHIKIDVDGFEHKVLAGASATLNNPAVRSIIIELNPNIPEHVEAIFALTMLGFEHDEQQVQKATRQGGAFKGVGEWIFRRPGKQSSTLAVSHTSTPSVLRQQTERGGQVMRYVLSRIQSTPPDTSPFPIFTVDHVFPDDYYREILFHFPKSDSLIPINSTKRTTGEAYNKRFVATFDQAGFSSLTEPQKQFWGEFGAWLYHPDFINGVVQALAPFLAKRLQTIQDLTHAPALVSGDALLVSDHSKYLIGPHTDAPHRLISFLFYFPKDTSSIHLGTSLYEPKQTGFTCAGTHHHKHEDFNIIRTIEFIPNRLVLFPKSDHCFHGVEPITDPNPKRQLLINNIRLIER